MCRSSLAALVGVGALACASPAMASGITNSGDDLRTGWYSDESALSPQLVAGGTFGQLWSANVDGQVYAQPLLSPTGTLVVATENNNVYGLNPTTGSRQWIRNLGTPWNPADLGCADIEPSIGMTSTPVIDSSTNTVYITFKTYASGTSGPGAWWMDALDVTTGAEKAPFPIRLNGAADNDSSVVFNPTTQQQRPGLLLMNGAVYAGFGSHCDNTPWQGWVFGVSAIASASPGQIKARWVDNLSGTDGGGIWQGGVGLSSDGLGSIFVGSGNGGSPSTPTPGRTPPSSLGESIIHLTVQANGTLKPVDFFTPFDAEQLDQFDADFGSGGVVGLPGAEFGTQAIPHLAVAVGKQGYLYLLNRDNLGGYDQGVGGGDDVVQRLGPRGGAYTRPGVWPGDGGYVYLTTGSGQDGGGLFDIYKYGISGSGTPSLTLVGSAPDVFGFGSGPAVITSDGTTSGSALVWTIWAANRTGAGGELRAYEPVPDASGHPVLVWRGSIGNATNYEQAEVGAGRLFVGTRDGTVLAFGSPVVQPLTGSSLAFPRTTIGSNSQLTLKLTATRSVTISSLASTSSQFTLAAPSLPATLAANQTISIPMTFSPTQAGVVGSQVNVGTDAGTVAFGLSGTGQPSNAKLAVSPAIVSLGGTTVGGHLSSSATISNIGGSPLTITRFDPPSAPFSASSLPPNGTTIDSGSSVTIELAFDPTAFGSFSNSLGIESNGGTRHIGLSASAGTPGALQISSETNDFGLVPVGSTATKTFTVTNAGGTNVLITKSKPPFGGAFTSATTLGEGTTITPGETLSESVVFAPTNRDVSNGVWQITGNDGSGLHTIQFRGTGVEPPTSSNSIFRSPAPPVIVTHPPPIKLVPPTVLPRVTSTSALAKVFIRYTASAARVSRFSLQRRVSGRRVRGTCKQPTARNGRAARCTYYVLVTTFRHADVVGTNRLRLISYVARRKLVPGTYRLRCVIFDAERRSHSSVVGLRVTAPAAHGTHRP